MHRFPQLLLIATFLPFCWLGMMAVHELGHVLAGWATGGTITQVVLHPLAISRTDVEPNPAPLAVVWLGPVVGCLLPLALWGLCRLLQLAGAFLARFFAGFCLVANGGYIGFGSFDRVGDAGVMLQCGSPIWTLWLFGAVTIPAGFLLWHGLGPRFGLGSDRGQVDPRLAYLSLCLLVAILVLEVLLSALS